jgi:hypothetical protein
MPVDLNNSGVNGSSNVHQVRAPLAFRKLLLRQVVLANQKLGVSVVVLRRRHAAYHGCNEFR